MDGVSSTLGVDDSDARMVNELENEGSGEDDEDAVMVCEELNDKEGDCVHVEEVEEVMVELEDPAGDIVGIGEGSAVVEDDQEGPGVGDMVLDHEGWDVNEPEEDGRMDGVLERLNALVIVANDPMV